MSGTIIVGSLFALLLGLAVRKIWHDTKNNKCSCGSTCSDRSRCHLK